MLSAILGVGALLLGWGIVGLALVSIAVNAVTLIILYVLTSRMFFRPHFEFDPAIQKVARAESFPLMLNHLLATLPFRVDVILPHGAIALQLMVISIPIGWINSVTNYVVIAIDKQRALTWTFLAGLAFNVIANLIFIPRVQYGYPAAAVITILSEAVLLVLFY